MASFNHTEALQAFKHSNKNQQPPVELFYPEHIHKTTEHGVTVIHMCLEKGQPEWIPEKDLTFENLSIPSENEKTGFYIAAKNGTLQRILRMSPDIIDAAALNKLTSQNTTPFMAACYSKRGLCNFPTEMITDNAFETQNSNTGSAMHILAIDNPLSISAEWLTTENLTRQNQKGETPAHCALLQNKLPGALLTLEVALIKDNHNYTPLQTFIRTKGVKSFFENVPPEQIGFLAPGEMTEIIREISNSHFQDASVTAKQWLKLFPKLEDIKTLKIKIIKNRLPSLSKNTCETLQQCIQVLEKTKTLQHIMETIPQDRDHIN